MLSHCLCSLGPYKNRILGNLHNIFTGSKAQPAVLWTNGDKKKSVFVTRAVYIVL